jgi:hypothetical protein
MERLYNRANIFEEYGAPINQYISEWIPAFHYEFNPVIYTKEIIDYYMNTKYKSIIDSIDEAMSKQVRHKLLHSIDREACLQYISINSDNMIAHFRAQNNIMRYFDEHFLSYVADLCGCKKIFVFVDNYGIIDLKEINY